MYSARLTQIGLGELAAPGDDKPVVRWPRPGVRRFEAEGRTVLQVLLPPEALAELAEEGREIEVQIVREDVI